MQELIYTSLADPEGTTTDVADILAVSQINNIAHDITGLLLFDGARYIQILEGPAPAVDRLFSKIATDPRHSAVELLHKGQIGGRSFDNWRMAYESLPPGLLDELAENMAVYALENEGLVLAAEDSFGARLNGMFMDAIAAE